MHTESQSVAIIRMFHVVYTCPIISRVLKINRHQFDINTYTSIWSSNSLAVFRVKGLMYVEEISQSSITEIRSLSDEFYY